MIFMAKNRLLLVCSFGSLLNPCGTTRARGSDVTLPVNG